MSAVPTYDFANLKDDVGIPVVDVSQDAWLKRRIAGVWSRFERYTMRYLGGVVSFQDQWQPVPAEVNSIGYHPTIKSSAYFLRNFPVLSIVEALDNGQTVDPATVFFNPKSGLLDGYGNRMSPSRFILPTITYRAGFQEMPGDLYEALVNVLRGLWATRSTDVSGLAIGGMVPNKLNITDVGSMDLTSPGTGFDSTLSAAAGYSDPYIGPYTYLLDPYADLRASIGSSVMPTTTTLDVPLTTTDFIMPAPDDVTEQPLGLSDATWVRIGMYLDVEDIGTLHVKHVSDAVLGVTNPGVTGNALEGTERGPGATVKQAGS